MDRTTTAQGSEAETKTPKFNVEEELEWLERLGQWLDGTGGYAKIKGAERVRPILTAQALAARPGAEKNLYQGAGKLTMDRAMAVSKIEVETKTPEFNVEEELKWLEQLGQWLDAMGGSVPRSKRSR